MTGIRNSMLIGALTGGMTLWLISEALSQEKPPNPDVSVITVNPASKARIKFENDLWDFGSMPKGGVVVHSFKFKNVGQDTLVLIRVRTTCGCTTAKSSDKVGPGEEASVRTTFNSEKFNGRINKQILVDSNDPINPYLRVSFTAVINNPTESIQVTPTEADFGTVRKGEKGLVKISLANNDTAAVNLKVAEVSSELMLRASLLNTGLAPHMTTDLALELEPQENLGEFKESITLEANGTPELRFTIPIRGIIVQAAP